MGFSRDANGWSIVTPSGSPVDGFVGNPGSGDTRKIYISDSTGYDEEGIGTTQGNGSKAHPYKTIDKGRSRLRQGSPDQLLLANGDTFTNQSFVHGGGSAIGGAGATDRMVYASYDRSENSPDIPNPGTSTPMPLVKIPVGESGVGFMGNNTAVMGIDFYSWTRDPNSPAFDASNPNLQETSGFAFAGTNSLVEDCNWRFFHTGGEFAGITGYIQEIRRCRIVDSHNLNDKVSCGIGTGGGEKGGNTVTLEQNLFDINGYNPTINPTGSFLNHNMYCNSNNTLVPNDPNTAIYTCNLYGNISAHEPSQGVSQQRCGGHNNNNLWLMHTAGGMNYGNTNPGALNRIENDVAFGLGSPPQDNQMYWLTGSLGPDDHGGFYGLSVPGMTKMLITNCICIGNVPNRGSGAPFAIGGTGTGALYEIHNCISYKYSYQGFGMVDSRYGDARQFILTGYNIVTDTNNQSWPDPDRTIPTYMRDVIHGTTAEQSVDGYLARCRQQRKGNWNPLLMSESVNDYERGGFGVAPVGSAYAGGGTIATGTVTVRDAAGTTASAPVTLNIS